VTTIRLKDFSGLAPRRSARLLPEQAATRAENTKLLSGELRGFTEPEQIADFTDEYFTVKRAIRVPYDDYGTPADAWLLFDSRDVDVVRSPIINDTYNRYYWAGDGPPMFNTVERIASGQEGYLLGVPQPVTAPTVTPPAGDDSTRAYVYTFVNAFNEEGPPSDPTVETGGIGTWVISAMDTSHPEEVERVIDTKRIYRTVSGSSQTLYYFVAEIPLAQADYNDGSSDDEVALNNVLESTEWFPPSEDMEGWAAMPGGYMVGWSERRIMFSEPYHPHAWPPSYEQATEFEIVAFGVFAATLVIGTVSQPYVGQGQNPASFTMQKLGTVDPCLSRRSMVATVVGVYYASINGLTMVNASGSTNITQDLMTKQEWAAFQPEGIYAAQLGLQYIGFYDSIHGFIFNPSEAQARLVTLTSFTGVEGIETDAYTGNVYLIQNDLAMDWDPEGGFPVDWRWKSKEFQTAKPLNFGAYRVDFAASDIDTGDSAEALYGAYNEARLAARPLSTLGGHLLGGGGQTPGLVPGFTLPEWRMPLGGSPLYPIDASGSTAAYVRVRVFAGGDLKYDYILADQKIYRLPAGFKDDIWQVELISNATVYSFAIAENAKELEKV
jgi:hypothetical protein